MDWAELAAVVVAIGVYALIQRWRPLTFQRQLWIVMTALIAVFAIGLLYTASRPYP